MKQFNYKARNNEGKIVSGLVESISPEQAARALQERKLLVLDVSERRSFDFSSILKNGLGKGVSERDIATFTRLLSTMLSTGLPLTDSLSNLVNQTRSRFFREVIQTVMHDVQGGIALSEAMSRAGNVFDELYINLVKAGEASGKVDEALGKLADTLEANLDFKSKVTGAMIYPVLITMVMGGIGIFMVTNIIPKIAEVYKEFGSELPLPTKVLMTISDLIRNYIILVVLFLVLVYFGIRALKKNSNSDYVINNAMFKIPVMGLLNQEVSLSIICRTLGTLLSTGVGILESLKIVSKTMANNFYRSGLTDASRYVEKGLPLSQALRRDANFPPMISQLIAIGEETGTLDQSLGRLAQFYQDAAERKIKVLTTLLEPMMILLMGGMVAGLAIAVLLPMFNLVNVIK